METKRNTKHQRQIDLQVSLLMLTKEESEKHDDYRALATLLKFKELGQAELMRKN
jgi:hypothetical protein